MFKYPLEALLNLRQHRLEHAQKMKQAQRQIVTMALQNYQAKEQEYKDFKVFKEQETERIYNSIVDQVLSQKELNKTFAKVANLDIRLQEIGQEVELALKKYQEQKRKLEECNQKEKAYNLSLLKLQTHKEKFIAKEQKELNYKEEQELEEFMAKPHDYSDI